MAALRDFFDQGFTVVGPVVPAAELARLRAEADRLLAAAGERGGCRDGLRRSGRLRELGESPPLAALAQVVLGPAARLVRLTIFDKTPRANWKVPWHQDLTIAVRERLEVAGFGPWSMKAGLPHVQPPVEILRAVVALRLHLDDTGEDDGALRVLPGTHRRGRLAADEIRWLSRQLPAARCPVVAGGAMLMSPLLVHASSAARTPSRRRVLHFEYAAAELPGGLQWAAAAGPARVPAR